MRVLSVVAPPLVSQPVALPPPVAAAYATPRHARWGVFFENLGVQFAYATTTIAGVAVPFFVMVPLVVGGVHASAVGMEMLVGGAGEDQGEHL